MIAGVSQNLPTWEGPGIDKKTHGIPCTKTIHIGAKNEPSYISYRCCSDRLDSH